MKRFSRVGLACAIVLVTVSIVAAQSRPAPVVRMGDWVEIGDDVWFNIVHSITTRYRTTHNLDFDDDIQDTNASTSPDSSILRLGRGDHLSSEQRFGFDMRYGKQLKARLLFENEIVFDGSIIDADSDAIHTERFWIDYAFPGTPIRMRVGSWLHDLDIAALVSDDDPGIHFFVKQGNWDLKFAAIVEEEGSIRGRFLSNDNDDIHYEFIIAYNMKPHRFCLCVSYERDRRVTGDTHHDYAVVMPGWAGRLGPIKAMLQGNFGFGTAEDVSTGTDFDIFTWSIWATAELTSGMVRPVIGLIVASGDDDATDTDLNGFNNFSHGEITLGVFRHGFTLQDGGTFNDWGPAPALAPIGNALSTAGLHWVYAPFVIGGGQSAHTGITSALSNPGTLALMTGVRLYPARGHTIHLWYIYYAMLDTAVLEAAGGTRADGTALDVSKTLWHELGVKWFWTLNKHFSIRPRAYIIIPDEGSKDIASTVDCDPGAGVRNCAGDDIALVAEIQFRTRF